VKAAGILHEIPLIIDGGDIFGETPARPYHLFGAVVPVAGDDEGFDTRALARKARLSARP